MFVTKGFSTDIYTLPPEKSHSVYKIWSSYITDDSFIAFRFSVCLDCIFINGCAGTVCV